MIGEVHEGQSLLLKATIKNQEDAIVDISDATSKKLVLESPDGVRTENNADFTDDGVDGEIEYLIVAAVLDEVNKKAWEYQFVISRPGGLIYPSDIGSFVVLRNL